MKAGLEKNLLQVHVIIDSAQFLMGYWTENLSSLLAVGRHHLQFLATRIFPKAACFMKASKRICEHGNYNSHGLSKNLVNLFIKYRYIFSHLLH